MSIWKKILIVLGSLGLIGVVAATLLAIFTSIATVAVGGVAYAVYDQVSDQPEFVIVEVQRELTPAERVAQANLERQNLEAAAAQAQRMTRQAELARARKAREAKRK